MDALERKCDGCGCKFRITPIELRFMTGQNIKPGNLCRTCALKAASKPVSALISDKSKRSSL